MGKKSFVANTLRYKCPRCQQGDLFNKPMVWANPVDMPVACPDCGQLFEPEPGFYYGSMFLSYIISAFVYLGIMALCIMIFGLSLNISFLILLVLAVVSYVFLIRFSRSLWINLMVSYDANAIQGKTEKDAE
jgi:uncharacterized protein (DUF983 family)